MELSEKKQAKSANTRTHLTEPEVMEILELARKTSARDWCIFTLAFNHGMRVSECAGGVPATESKAAVPPIRLSDLDMRNRRVTIRRLKGSLETTQPLVDLRGKPALSGYAALKAYLKVRIDDGSGLLFTGQKGPIQRWTLTRIFRVYCQQVSTARVARGLAPIPGEAMHFHVLKHSIATILANRGDHIFQVKSHLGHASISSTMNYCNSDPRTTGAYVQQTLSNAFCSL
jgi:integrase